ncbi:unnamed protein product, partial [Closterium sp. NIES-54]
CGERGCGERGRLGVGGRHGRQQRKAPHPPLLPHSALPLPPPHPPPPLQPQLFIAPPPHPLPPEKTPEKPPGGQHPGDPCLPALLGVHLSVASKRCHGLSYLLHTCSPQYFLLHHHCCPCCYYCHCRPPVSSLPGGPLGLHSLPPQGLGARTRYSRPHCVLLHGAGAWAAGEGFREWDGAAGAGAGA